jgi:hypothetical protein
MSTFPDVQRRWPETGYAARPPRAVAKSEEPEMARVQSFNAGKGGNLKADAPIACKSATGALRTAERLALSKLGVVAFSSTGDPEMGDYDDEPIVIFRNGQFPAAFD